MIFGRYSLYKNDDKLEQMLPIMTILTLSQLKHNLKFRMHRRGIHQMVSLSEKGNKTTCREGVWELKRNQSLFKNRYGGDYDRKPFSITIPILSRKAQIKEMLFFFTF